ncbi:hypothetical protein HU200_062112 [Digitaria exilis]|uniref:NADH dehydrogenase [ubiquinone] iron-sulfur protein 5 n=1 Tax=Digitaria exilis TaxID=1010633 RepID=A0A835AGM4_9POAL|nr:hypothetical protein HU200_062112 [Digitaria exilis]
MASGWGINGNKGRCYDFWLDFSECMSRCRQPSDCGLLREDYLECLHHSKEVTCPALPCRLLPLLPATISFDSRPPALNPSVRSPPSSFRSTSTESFVILLQFQRRNRIYKEEQRQIRAAARKAKEEAEGAPAVAAHH